MSSDAPTNFPANLRVGDVDVQLVAGDDVQPIVHVFQRHEHCGTARLILEKNNEIPR